MAIKARLPHQRLDRNVERRRAERRRHLNRVW